MIGLLRKAWDLSAVWPYLDWFAEFLGFSFYCLRQMKVDLLLGVHLTVSARVYHLKHSERKRKKMQMFAQCIKREGFVG